MKNALHVLASINILLVMTTASTSVSAQGRAWRKIQPLSEARFFSKSAAISDHEVLVIGGYSQSITALMSCERIDVINGTTRPDASMGEPRVDFGMVQLPDSNIIVLGGYGNGVLVSSIEQYDRTTQRWSKIGDVSVPRRQLTAFLITPTKILTVGGRDENLTCLRDCEVFDLTTKKSRPVQAYPVRTSLCMVERMSDGTIIAFAGREGGPGSVRHKELYAFDVATEKWSLKGSYPTPIYFPYIVTLPNGKLFSTGGSYQESGNAENTYSDLLAIESSVGFDSIGHLNGPRDLHCAVLHENNSVLVIGGANEVGVVLSTCEIVDPVAGTSSPGPELNQARDLFNAVRLIPASDRSDNLLSSVIAIGGRDENGVASASVEVLNVLCDGTKQLNMMATADRIRLNGSAAWLGKRVMLTDTVQDAISAMWYTNRISIRNGFETDFSFRIAFGSDHTQPDGGSPGADGIAFVIQASSVNALGAYGKGIGYNGIKKSLAVEFDTYANFENSDPNGNHVAVQTGGTLANQADHRAPFALGASTSIETIQNDGRPYYGRITYADNELKIYFNEYGNFTTPVLAIRDVDIASLIGLGEDSTVWMGFTSATGVAWARHEILTWSLQGCVSAQVPSTVEDDGDNESAISSIAVHPNPANSSVAVHLNSPVECEGLYQLLDQRGEIVVSRWYRAGGSSAATLHVDVANMPPGMYVVRVIIGPDVITSQVVIMH